MVLGGQGLWAVMGWGQSEELSEVHPAGTRQHPIDTQPPAASDWLTAGCPEGLLSSLDPVGWGCLWLLPSLDHLVDIGLQNS